MKKDSDKRADGSSKSVTPAKDRGEKVISNLLNFEEFKKTTKKSSEEFKEIDKKFRQLVREQMEETILKLIDLFVDVEDNTSRIQSNLRSCCGRCGL